jgi:hypothetical protein
MRRLALLLLLASSPAAAADNTRTTKYFLDECGETLQDWTSISVGFCVGSLSMLEAMGPHLVPELRFCSGPQTAFQLATTLRYYVRAHPEALDADHLKVMSAAFRERWPCP